MSEHDMTPRGPMEIPEFVPAPEMLDVYRRDYKVRVDVEADARLGKFVTVSPVRSMVYDRKSREALQAIDDPNPTAEEYPLLAASILRTDQPTKADFDAVAATVITKDLETARAFAAIERVRLVSKAALSSAASVEDVLAIYNAIVWPEV